MTELRECGVSGETGEDAAEVLQKALRKALRGSKLKRKQGGE
jgi:hypothetical protein